MRCGTKNTATRSAGAAISMLNSSLAMRGWELYHERIVVIQAARVESGQRNFCCAKNAPAALFLNENHGSKIRTIPVARKLDNGAPHKRWFGLPIGLAEALQPAAYGRVNELSPRNFPARDIRVEPPFGDS